MGFDEQLQLLQQSALLDPEWYLGAYPDVRAAGMEAEAHYLKYGARMGRDPGPDFSTLFYIKQNPDVIAGGWNPLIHYLAFGAAEGRAARP